MSFMEMTCSDVFTALSTARPTPRPANLLETSPPECGARLPLPVFPAWRPQVSGRKELDGGGVGLGFLKSTTGLCNGARPPSAPTTEQHPSRACLLRPRGAPSQTQVHLLCEASRPPCGAREGQAHLSCSPIAQCRSSYPRRSCAEQMLPHGCVASLTAISGYNTSGEATLN